MARTTLTPRQSGFTLIELVVVICVIGVLARVFMDRVWFYQEQAEAAAMEQVVAALQSALTLQFGSLMAQGRGAEISSLAKENPMNWLARKPADYAGEFFEPGPKAVPPGSWMFDLKSRELVYVVDRADHFTPAKDRVKWVRYRVELVREHVPSGSKGNPIVVSAVLEQVDACRWFDRRL
jgi:prepilin-type N-terminal cleavage/methylation domain-containing protein